MSDRIAVMNHGRVEQVAGPEDVYERPDDDLRRRLHRRLQPDAGQVISGSTAARRGSSSTPGSRSRRPPTATRTGERCHAVVRPEKLSDRCPQRRSGARPLAERRGHRRELGLPRHRDPDRRRASRRGPDDRAGPERRRGRAGRLPGGGAPCTSPGRRSTSTWSASPAHGARHQTTKAEVSEMLHAGSSVHSRSARRGRSRSPRGLAAAAISGAAATRASVTTAQADARSQRRPDDLQLARSTSTRTRSPTSRRRPGSTSSTSRTSTTTTSSSRKLQPQLANGESGRPQHLRRHRLDGEEDVRPRLPAELRQERDPERQQEPASRACSALASTPSATSRRPGRAA